MPVDHAAVNQRNAAGAPGGADGGRGGRYRQQRLRGPTGTALQGNPDVLCWLSLLCPRTAALLKRLLIIS